jgi:hypothetical protein
LVCGYIKNKLAQECLYKNLKKMAFCKKLFAEYIKKWQNCCSHGKKLEEEYWQQNGLMDEAINSMIVHLRELYR